MRIIQFTDEEHNDLLFLLGKLPPTGLLKDNIEVVAFANVIKKLGDAPHTEDNNPKAKKDDKTNN